MPKLEMAVMQVESSGFTGAIRFEDGLYREGNFNGPTVKAIQQINRCSPFTAEAIYCTSYGLFQIMGETLYSTLGYQQPVASFWIDSEQQITQFRCLCERGGFDWQNFDPTDDNLRAFARYYNGPGAVDDYSAKLRAAFASQSAV